MLVSEMSQVESDHSAAVVEKDRAHPESKNYHEQTHKMQKLVQRLPLTLCMMKDKEIISGRDSSRQ